MPLYEYECNKCGSIKEALQQFSDKPLTTCDICSGSLTKLISQSTFHLKGTGWYVTDYAKDSSHCTPNALKSEGSEEKNSVSEKTVKSENTVKSEKSTDNT